MFDCGIVIVRGFKGFIALRIESGYVYVPRVIGIYMPSSAEYIVFILSVIRYVQMDNARTLFDDMPQRNSFARNTHRLKDLSMSMRHNSFAQWSPFLLRSEAAVHCKCFISKGMDLPGRFLNS
ncbi:hypothetical protein EUGRSUZ_K00023 [Eucalyptus grandis]|uniref:Uncharacterized protein n=2 Tax=Eucalyptus grandis TaxID=71139 RepID=A0ACC3IQG3_EUCGR|nr:hypothetical protein EUGRSUZ_K00023 [Eucalyptus grandis]